LDSPLFDDERLEVLGGLRFRNHVLQEILQLLSLSNEKKGRRRGRISYAQLGINQLGAVYEGLLSYTGFFANEDLYEVANPKDIKELERSTDREKLKSYFVPESRIGEYEDKELLRQSDGRPVKYEKGSYLFRLAGRDREKSASYYTPEVLTRCLVKYTLKELLHDKDGADKFSADEILALTICEPAMGSGAFLNEAVDQMAEAYLAARERELDQRIPPEDWAFHKRRVKARLATNNAFGVDLNPVAVELAKVSLWLGTLHEHGKCPWFGLRLAHGNSLIGARRQVFHRDDIVRKKSKAAPNWLGLVPEEVPLYREGRAVDASWTAPPRPKDTVYHFLLPAEGMVSYAKDKTLKQIEPDAAKAMQAWKSAFTAPLSGTEAQRLIELSDAVDRLFARVVRDRSWMCGETSDRIPVWGEDGQTTREDFEAASQDLLVRDQEEIARELEEGSSAHRRLKLAMDAWCALWFWPVDQVDLLPDRRTWISLLELILKGKVEWNRELIQPSLFTETLVQQSLPETADTHAVDFTGQVAEASMERLSRLKSLSEEFQGRRSDYLETCGLADMDVLIEEFPFLAQVQSVADRIGFHHWELRFAEVFAERGGFDLILGNPPWIRLQWSHADWISDHAPITSIRKKDEQAISEHFCRVISEPICRSLYLGDFAAQSGTISILGLDASFDVLRGMTPNLYKGFVVIAFRLISPVGSIGLLFPEGIFHQKAARHFRAMLFKRLRLHLHFRNELKLFPEVMNTRQFGVSVFGEPREAKDLSFSVISNLFHPSTVDSCFESDGHGRIPGLKSAEGRWECLGHKDRIVVYQEAELRQVWEMFEDKASDFMTTMLPVLHSSRVKSAISGLLANSRRLASLGRDQFHTSSMWSETQLRKKGLLTGQDVQPLHPEELIITGSHLLVSNPFGQTANVNCRNYRDFRGIDLLGISGKFLPRSRVGIDTARLTDGFLDRVWEGKDLRERYRHVHREMISLTGERGLVSAIVPPGPGHVNTVLSVAFKSIRDLVNFSSLTSSLPLDFYLGVTGKDHASDAVVREFPLVDVPDEMLSRTLRLNCLSKPYARLWEEVLPDGASADSFVAADRRLVPFGLLSETWKFNSALRDDLSRRQALLEIDVLSSMTLGWSIEDLLSALRSQFPLLMHRDSVRKFDQHGREVPSSKTVGGKPAVSLISLGQALGDLGFDVNAAYDLSDPALREVLSSRVKLSRADAGILGVSERTTLRELMAETEVTYWDEEHPDGYQVKLHGLRYSDPGLEPFKERVYPTPWTRCDREEDYRVAWAEFERRFGRKFPEEA